jgi:hypothetical protein
MQTININKLPPQARIELLDFYEFLLKKYMPFEKIAKDGEEPTKSICSGQPRIGELAVKLFGSTAGIDLNLPKHSPHKPLDFGL